MFADRSCSLRVKWRFGTRVWFCGYVNSIRCDLYVNSIKCSICTYVIISNMLYNNKRITSNIMYVIIWMMWKVLECDYMNIIMCSICDYVHGITCSMWLCEWSQCSICDYTNTIKCSIFDYMNIIKCSICGYVNDVNCFMWLYEWHKTDYVKYLIFYRTS